MPRWPGRAGRIEPKLVVGHRLLLGLGGRQVRERTTSIWKPSGCTCTKGPVSMIVWGTPRGHLRKRIGDVRVTCITKKRLCNCPPRGLLQGRLPVTRWR